MSDLCKKLKNPQGEVIGLWVADPNDPNLKTLVAEFNKAEGLPANVFEEFKEGKYRAVANRYTKDGGAFLMIGDSRAPGEHTPPKKETQSVKWSSAVW